MKIIYVALAVLMCLPMFVSAVPENVTIGSYNISFDLGLPHGAYTITTKGPTVSETLDGANETSYGLIVNSKANPSHEIGLSMGEYELEQMGASLAPEEMKKKLEMAFIKSFKVDRITTRTIDEKTGAIAEITKNKETMFSAIYYPNAYTAVVIILSFPWDEGTLSFLKTIHIEKINATV